MRPSMNRRTFLQTTAAAAVAAASGVVTFRGRAASNSDAKPTGRSVPSRIPRFNDGRDWFFQKRFGMFVHWGLYAIPRLARATQWRRRVPRDEYQKLPPQWNPVQYDPDAWLDLAAEAGMKYVCLTTKHHDGFCLWTPSTRLQHDEHALRQATSQDAGRRLPSPRFPLCLYYSSSTGTSRTTQPGPAP